MTKTKIHRVCVCVCWRFRRASVNDPGDPAVGGQTRGAIVSQHNRASEKKKKKKKGFAAAPRYPWKQTLICILPGRWGGRGESARGRNKNGVRMVSDRLLYRLEPPVQSASIGPD